MSCHVCLVLGRFMHGGVLTPVVEFGFDCASASSRVEWSGVEWSESGLSVRMILRRSLVPGGVFISE